MGAFRKIRTYTILPDDELELWPTISPLHNINLDDDPSTVESVVETVKPNLCYSFYDYIINGEERKQNKIEKDSKIKKMLIELVELAKSLEYIRIGIYTNIRG
jgi:hypothetical protein